MWPRKWRVGANSPSRCPTMFSVMYMGTCRRPSWTAMVWPTICGKMVLARLQVRTTFFSFRVFMASIFFKSLGSMNGPFFSDRDISSTLYPVKFSNRALAAALAAVAHNVFVGLLVTASLVSKGWFTPRSFRTGHTNRLAAFTTTMRMVAGGHRGSANSWPYA